MRRKLFCLLFIVFVYSMFCSSVNCEDRSAQNQPQVFTNEDIEKYQTSSDTRTVPEQPASQEDRKVSRKDKKKRIAEEHEMEYWCKKASTFKRKIEKADEDIKEIEKELSEEHAKSFHSGKKTTQLQKRLEKAKKQFRNEEEDLAALEDEAHRKGIKPGWLRCQFE